MQIFVRSPGARNLSASHNFEDTVVAMTTLIGVFVVGISLRCATMERKKEFALRFSFVFDGRESGRQNTTDGCHERDYVTIVKYA